MENKRINVLFCLVLIFFLALTYILIRDFNARRVNDYNAYVISYVKTVKQKNDKIRQLYASLVAEEKENANLKNTLTETRNDLESLSKKLGQPASPTTATK